jgi:hypothetical protein
VRNTAELGERRGGRRGGKHAEGNEGIAADRKARGSSRSGLHKHKQQNRQSTNEEGQMNVEMTNAVLCVVRRN